MNSLSHDTAISLINRAIDYGIKVKQVFVDTVGPADKYEAKLKRIFPSLKIKVANKADSIYPIVSAASICAKVIRDRTLKDWKFIEKDSNFSNKDYGSGYPSGRAFMQSILLFLISFSFIPSIISDPTTKKFLSKNIDPIFGFPTLVRFSWSTAKNLLDENAIECQWFVTLLSLLSIILFNQKKKKKKNKQTFKTGNQKKKKTMTSNLSQKGTNQLRTFLSPK